MLPDKPPERLKQRGLKSAAIVFFMDMPFGTAQDSPSSFLVFAGSFRFEGLQDLAVIVREVSLEFFHRSEANFDHKTLEQPGADITVGLVVVLSVGVDVAHGFCQGQVQGRLEVVQDKMAVNILPAVIDGAGREIGKLEE